MLLCKTKKEQVIALFFWVYFSTTWVLAIKSAK